MTNYCIHFLRPTIYLDNDDIVMLEGGMYGDQSAGKGCTVSLYCYSTIEACISNIKDWLVPNFLDLEAFSVLHWTVSDGDIW